MPFNFLGWIFIFAFYPSLLTAGMGEIRYQQVETFLQENGITEYYSVAGFSAIQKYLNSMKEERELAIKNEQLKEDVEDELEFIEYAQGLAEEIELSDNNTKKSDYYLRIKHIVYSLIAPKFQPEKFPTFYYIKEA